MKTRFQKPSRRDGTRRRPRALGGLAAAAALLCLAVPQAQAWNGTGHMTVAQIAYDHLTPKTKASVDALLARHKDYGKWMSLLPAGYTDRQRFAFLEAAMWPDDIRTSPDDRLVWHHGDPSESRPLWHYVDTPVIAPGYQADPAATAPVVPNAETQIPVERTLLGDARAADGRRAIALCWVEHLVGDIHQPLHDVSLFSPLFPKGDKGGNSDLLAPGATDGDPVLGGPRPPRNLHALWDDMLGTTHDPTQIAQIATRLEGPLFARKTYPQIVRDTTIPSWVTEGNGLAQGVTYMGGKLPSTPDGDRADVSLPPGYLNLAHAVADRQVALAGLRLADLLNATHFPAVTAPPTPPLPPVAASPTGSPAAQGPVIGNKNSHVYHLPGDTGLLPAEENRVYFPTEDAAIKAGYHKPGGAN